MQKQKKGKQENHTHIEKVGHTSHFLVFIDDLQKQLFIKKLLKGHFLPFYPPKNLKMRILKKWKKLLEISFYTCLPKITIIWCAIPEIQSKTDRMFYHFGPLFALYSPPEAPADVIILDMCTKNHNHMIYASSNMKCNRKNLLVIFGHFFPFTPLTTQKIKILKKWN